MKKTGVEKRKEVKVENTESQKTESVDAHKPGRSGEDLKERVNNSNENSTSSFQKEQVPSETEKTQNENDTSGSDTEQGADTDKRTTENETTSGSESSEEAAVDWWQTRTMAQAVEVDAGPQRG
jgi:hypothetical protein